MYLVQLTAGNAVISLLICCNNANNSVNERLLSASVSNRLNNSLTWSVVIKRFRKKKSNWPFRRACQPLELVFWFFALLFGIKKEETSICNGAYPWIPIRSCRFCRFYPCQLHPPVPRNSPRMMFQSLKMGLKLLFFFWWGKRKTDRSTIANGIQFSTWCSLDSEIRVYLDGFLVHLIGQVGCHLFSERIHRNPSGPEYKIRWYFMFLDLAIRISGGVNHLVGLHGAHATKYECGCWELGWWLCTVPKWSDSRRLFWILPGVTGQDPACGLVVWQTSAYLLIASEY